MDFEHVTADRIPDDVKADLVAPPLPAKRLHGEIESEILEEERWDTTGA